MQRKSMQIRQKVAIGYNSGFTAVSFVVYPLKELAKI